MTGSGPAPRAAAVHSFPMAHPGDVSELRQAIHDGRVPADEIVCIMAKTEGNGLNNDHTRAYATDCLTRLLADRLAVPEGEVAERVTFIISGGTEGVTQPTLWAFTRGPAPDGSREGPSLAIGRSFTRDMTAAEIGRAAQAHLTAEAVRAAMADAAIADPRDAVYVQIKCPILTPALLAAHQDATPPVAADAHGSKPASRGAAALGAAIALGDMPDETRIEEVLLRRPDIFTGRAGATAAIDRAASEILVIGMSPAWRGEFAATSAVLQDMLDIGAMEKALMRLGLRAASQLPPDARERVAAVLVKGEPSRDDRIRGRRHTMWHDSDVHALRHFRAAMSGLLGGLLGDTRFYISAGAEHQGPPGGATLAIIARRGLDCKQLRRETD